MDKQKTFDLFDKLDDENKTSDLSTEFDITEEDLNDATISNLSVDTEDLLNLTATLALNVEGSDFTDFDEETKGEIVLEEKSVNENSTLQQHIDSVIANNTTTPPEEKPNSEIHLTENKVTDDEIINQSVGKISGMTTAFETMNVEEKKATEEVLVKVVENENTMENFGRVNIMVIGIGACGCNAVSRMFEERIKEINFVAIDTSSQTLNNVSADKKILIGQEEFSGHGSGGNVALTEKVFDDAKSKIQVLLDNVDMVFVAGGIGRGTGSVGLSKVGEFAREMGILTIGFATLPRKNETDANITKIYYDKFIESVDSTVIVENDKVLTVTKNLTIRNAMAKADSMLVDGIKGVFELITKPGKINLDYADIKTAFKNQGAAVMGVGYGKGENAVVKGIEEAIHSDIINIENIRNAKTIIFNITCAKNTVTIDDASKGTEMIYSLDTTSSIEHLFFGYSYDETLGEKVKVTFVASGTEHTDITFENSHTSAFSGFSSSSENKKMASEGISLFGEKAAAPAKKTDSKEQTGRFPNFFK